MRLLKLLAEVALVQAGFATHRSGSSPPPYIWGQKSRIVPPAQSGGAASRPEILKSGKASYFQQSLRTKDDLDTMLADTIDDFGVVGRGIVDDHLNEGSSIHRCRSDALLP